MSQQGGNKMIYAAFKDFNNVVIHIENPCKYTQNNFRIYNGNNSLEIAAYSISDDEIIIQLKDEIDIKKQCRIEYIGLNIDINISFNDLYNSSEFNDKFFYPYDLGCSYSPNKTIFRVWSPIAQSVVLQLYKNGDPDLDKIPEKIPMSELNGLWSVEISRDIKGYFYTYLVKTYEGEAEAGDPYAAAVGINGIRSAVIDLKDTDPQNFYHDKYNNVSDLTDAIIYEASIRDISKNHNSGIINGGKYLGFTEENTVNSNNEPTGINHIKELGITHVQLMPVFDFSFTSVDERNPVKYNWGYDPQNFNVPEGSYATDAYNPLCRIKELKALIQCLHRNNIGVIMDVVYNHIFSEKDNNFEKIFPGYYFRKNPDGSFVKGSGCQNDTASERSMYRKFMLDSTRYWAEEYHLDGFRFDLMGLHDVETMNLIKENLNKLNRNIFVYGEGWALNTLLSDERKAKISNAFKTPCVGYFNDIIRDSVKGSVFIGEDRGFISGKPGMESTIKKCAAGCINYRSDLKGPLLSASQSVNYVSCHDNNTLWDKIDISCSTDDQEFKKSLQKFANAIIFTSQGVPFLHSGEEFCRTKYHSDNSFNLPDNINSIDWDRKTYLHDIFEYYNGLVEIRKKHAAFRMSSADDIRKHLLFLENTPTNTVAFMLTEHANNDTWRNILVIYNANRNPVIINVPYNTYYRTANNAIAGCNVIDTVTGDKIKADAISMNLFFTD